MAGSAQKQSVEYSLKVEIDDLKRALNDSLILLKGNDAGVRALAEQLNMLAGAQNRVTAGARRNTSAFNQARQSTQGLAEASRAASINVKSLAFQLGALVGVFGVADVLRRTSTALYENARAYDTIRAKLSLVTADSREGAAVMDYVRGRADALGVAQRSLIDSYVRLKIASRGSVVEGRATKAVFEGLTTASAALRLSTDETRRAMKAFEQIISKGKLSAEEIRQQLGDVLPGALQVFQEASGKSAREFDKLLAEGKLFISSGMFEKIAAILTRDYSKGVKLDTIAAQVSLLSNAFDEFFQTVNIGGGQDAISGMIATLTRTIKDATTGLNSLRVSGIEAAHAVTMIGTAVGGLLAANLLGRLAASLMVARGAIAATGLASIANVARLLAFRNALLAMLAPFGGPLGIAAVAAVTFFSTYRTAAEEAADKTLELRNRTYDLIEVIDLLSKQAAQTRLTAVRDEMEKTAKLIEDLEKKVPKNAPSVRDLAMSGKNEFGIASQFNASSEIAGQLEEARVQFGLMSGEAIRLEGRLAAVEREARNAASGADALADATGGAAKSFRDEIEFMRLKLDLMTEGYELDQLDAAAKMVQAGITRDQIGDYFQLKQALDSYAEANANAKKEAAELAREQEKAAESLDRFLASDGLKSLGSTMRDAFNEAGGAVGDLIGRLDDLGGIQEKNAKAIEDNNTAYANDAKKRGEMEVRIAKKTQQANVGTYASMASAAKGFFNENSKGYRTLEAIEQGFRAFELAMALESALTRVTLEEGVTAAKVLGDQTQVASGAAASTAIVGQKMAEGTASAVSGVANQANGDPYSAFGRMAVMAAIMAALGFATGGFSSKGSAMGVAPRARNPGLGTGTVLGDAEAASESISRGLEEIAKISDADLDISRAMLLALRSIDMGIRGVGLTLVQRAAMGGSVTGFNMPASGPEGIGQAQMNALHNLAFASGQISTGGMHGITVGVTKIIDEAFGTDLTGMAMGFAEDFTNKVLGGMSRAQVNTGLAFTAGQNLGQIITEGISASFFATIRETEDAEFGRTVSDTYRDVLRGVDQDIKDNFTQVVMNLADTIVIAVDLLGGDMATARAAIEGMTLGIGKVGLGGLKADEIQERLAAVFSALGDRMAEAVLPQMKEFQLVGEGLFQTLVRVASQTSAVSRLMTDMGMTLGQLGFIEKARVVQNLIDLAGGIDTFGQNVNGFIESFYTDQEKLTMAQGRLSRAFGEFGLTLPESRQAFRDMVVGLDLSTEANRKLFTMLTSVSGVMDEYFSLLTEVNEATLALTGALGSLLFNLRRDIVGLQGGDVALMDFNRALSNLLNAIDAETQIDAADEVRQAIMSRYDAEVQAIEKTRDAQIEALNSQRAAVQETLKIIEGIDKYLESLRFTAMAPGTPAERTQAALEAFRAQTALALGGDQTAAGGLQSAAQEVLNLARETFASGGPFSDIFGEITGSLEMVSEALSIGTDGVLVDIDAQIADATATANVLLEQLRLDTITQLTTLGEFMQYGNSRLDAMLMSLTGGVLPAPVQTFAGGGISDGPAIFGEAGPEAAVPLPDGRRIPVELRGETGGNREIVAELRKLREEVAERDQPVNFTFEMPDGSKQIVAMTLKQLRDKSQRGEAVIYAGGIRK